MKCVALLVFLTTTTTRADPEAAARTKVRHGKLGVGVGLVMTAVGGGVVYYYGSYCKRTADRDHDGCVVKEVAVGGLIGLPLLAAGIIATGYGIGTSWKGDRELDEAVKVTAVPLEHGGMLAISGGF